jgi:hypothetical protein
MQLPALFPTWFTHIPIDWIVIVVFALLLSFDALRSGSGRATVLVIALPIAAYLSGLLPQTFVLKGAVAALSTPMLSAALFLVVFGIIYILTYRMTYNFGAIPGGLLFAFLAGISASIVTIVIWLQVPALSALWHFGTQVQSIFGAAYALLWLLAAYLILAFVRS